MPATDHATTWAHLEALSASILESNSAAELRVLLWGPDSWPRWYLQMLSQVHALTSNAEVRYVTSSVADSRVESDEIYVFTDELVVHVRVTDLDESGRGPNASVQTSAWRRDGLEDLGILELREYPVQDSGSDVEFPRGLRVALTYRGCAPVNLPLARFERSVQLDALFPSLLADLVR